ncbi:MAG: carboxypeptidase regulatory-like domain-containing protein [Cyanobacteria bacterium Co-bin13]|nr:carboxypeptidase regulatory-like domain-containing protein [Cyanobacteria bacterium Co-bin13]
MRRVIPIVLGCFGAAAGAAPALAHGAVLNYQAANSIQLEAAYDNGEPMVGAQILVYSPEDPSEPWLEGTTDDQGRFLFTPDSTLPGNWEATVRQAGHGSVITIPLTDTAAIATAGDGSRPGSNEANPGSAVVPARPGAAQSAGRPSPVQQGIMVGSVIWGFIGTALFFSRGKR